MTGNDAVNNFTGTGLKEVVESMETNTLVTLLQEQAATDVQEQIAGKTAFDSSILVEFESAEIKSVSTGTLFNEIAYDVKPIVKTTVTDNDGHKTVVQAVIPNEEITSALKFRLPVSFDKGAVVEVLHEGAHHAYAVVQGDGTDKYVEVEGTKFSIYSCREQETLPWAYNTDSGKYTKNGVEKGVVRFLYNTGLQDKEVLESKVFFFDFSPFAADDKITEADIDSATGNKWKVAPAGVGFGAFHADLVDLVPVSDTYYSIGVVRVKTAENDTDGTWKASAVQKCETTFSKDLGDAYSPIAPIQPSNAE